MLAKLQFFRQTNFNFGLMCLILPWLIIIGYTSVLTTVITFMAVVAGMLSIGKAIFKTISAELSEEDIWLLSLPTGYLTVSGLTALSAKLGMSPLTIFWSLAGIAVSCLAWQFLRREFSRVPNLRGFWALVPISLVIAFLYYLPGAIRDAIYLPDGSFNWMYVDTQFHMALASSVKSSLETPWMPGTSFASLNYHFGPYAIAGILSGALDIPLGDALVRVVRPTALVSLVLSTYAAGRFLGRGHGLAETAGILSVVGLFFYGSFTAFLADPIFSGLTEGNILSEMPRLIQSSGGMFAHLILGHSQVHGMNALLVLVIVLLAKLQTRDVRNLKLDPSALGPAIVFPSSILLGFACLGLNSVMFLWFGARSKRKLLFIGVSICAAIASAWAMGYLGTLSSGNLVRFAPAQTITSKLYSTFVWFVVGLGIRQYAFTKISNPLRDPVSATLIILFCGFLATGMSIPEFDSRYGFLYFQGILGVFSFAWLSTLLYEAASRNWQEVFADVKRCLLVVCFSSLVFLLCSMVIYFIMQYKVNGSFDDSILVLRTIKHSGALALFTTAILLFFYRVKSSRPIITACVISVYLCGFAAWLPDWKDYGLGSTRRDVIISKGEVQGLEMLKKISDKGDLVVTNQHALPILKMNKPNRSFAYGALSERPFLVEGWDYYPGKNTVQFHDIITDNESVFTSENKDLVRSIIMRYEIKYIVARPGTDLAIANGLPEWLSLVSDTGSLKIYAVTEGGNSR